MNMYWVTVTDSSNYQTKVRVFADTPEAAREIAMAQTGVASVDDVHEPDFTLPGSPDSLENNRGLILDIDKLATNHLWNTGWSPDKFNLEYPDAKTDPLNRLARTGLGGEETGQQQYQTFTDLIRNMGFDYDPAGRGRSNRFIGRQLGPIQQSFVGQTLLNSLGFGSDINPQNLPPSELNLDEPSVFRNYVSSLEKGASGVPRGSAEALQTYGQLLAAARSGRPGFAPDPSGAPAVPNAWRAFVNPETTTEFSPTYNALLGSIGRRFAPATANQLISGFPSAEDLMASYYANPYGAQSIQEFTNRRFGLFDRPAVPVEPPEYMRGSQPSL